MTSTLPNTDRKPDILISNLSGTNNRDLYLDVSTTNPYGKTNQAALNRHRRGVRPTDDLVPCETHLHSAAIRESQKVNTYRQLCAHLPSPALFHPFVLETTGGFGTSTKATISFLAQNIRDSSSLDPQVIISMFKRDVAFALRRGTAQQFRVITDVALEAAQRDCLPLVDCYS